MEKGVGFAVAGDVVGGDLEEEVGGLGVGASG